MTSSQIRPVTAAGMVSVRPMGEADLDRADEIFRVAFGTFLGVADPKEDVLWHCRLRPYPLDR
jgi:hypothetical protein